MVAYEHLQMIKPPVTDWTADTASEISSVDTQPAQVEPRRRTQRRQTRARTIVDDGDRLGRRGRRGTLRQYNENLLRQLKEAHEVEVEDEDYIPGYCNRETALSTLMNDNMCSEEWYNNSMHEYYEDGDSNVSNGINEDDDVKENEDCRKENPAAISAFAAYSRISWRLRRGLLRRRHLPTDEMNAVEETLREHFGWKADRSWSELSPPLRRLITHAVAEYLGLHSQSEDLTSEALRKKVNVSIRQPPFSPPRQQLTEFLSERSRPNTASNIRA